MVHSMPNHQKKKQKKKKINPVSPNWMIFGTSVAWHVCTKLAKPFEPIQNGFGDFGEWY